MARSLESDIKAEVTDHIVIGVQEISMVGTELYDDDNDEESHRLSRATSHVINGR